MAQVSFGALISLSMAEVTLEHPNLEGLPRKTAREVQGKFVCSLGFCLQSGGVRPKCAERVQMAMLFERPCG